jgi:hypothetical protein
MLDQPRLPRSAIGWASFGASRANRLHIRWPRPAVPMPPSVRDSVVDVLVEINPGELGAAIAADSEASRWTHSEANRASVHYVGRNSTTDSSPLGVRISSCCSLSAMALREHLQSGDQVCGACQPAGARGRHLCTKPGIGGSHIPQ